MRARRRRLCVTMAIVSTLAFVIYGTGSGSGQFSHTTSRGRNSAHSTGGLYHDEGSLLDWSQPSVFHLWHAHQPKPLVQSVSHDCLQLRGLSAQRTCSQRLQHVRDLCSQQQQQHQQQQADDGNDQTGETFQDEDGAGRGGMNDSVVDVFSYRQGGSVALYCSVHKVASTFWIRLFRFLHKDTGSAPASRPEAVSKFQVHLAPFSRSRPLALAYVTRTLRPGDEQFRFMFTRDPYRRLWAVYIDKFVLPDFFFWSHHARLIQDMNSLRTSGSQPLRRPPSSCLDVTFEDFVRYAVQDESSPTAHSDDHLLPITRTCDPCAFQPHFLGRMENMAEDSQAVLTRLNLSDIVQPTTYQERVLSQIQTVSQFVHDTVVERGNLRHCVSNDDLQGRLLRAFILSGYLPPEVADVRRTSVSVSLSELLTMVTDMFLNADRTELEIEAQKTRYFVSAYEALPWDLLNQVRDYYKEDFHTFGYDPEPKELFAGGEDTEDTELSLAL